MRLGYASINLSIPSKFRTCRLQTVEAEGVEKVKELTLHNLGEVLKIVKWNIEHRIGLYRVSSNLVPFGSHPIHSWRWWEDPEVLQIAAEIKQLRSQHQLRLTVHPGQFTLLTTPNAEVLERSIWDLEYHARLMELLDGDVIVLHVGGAYGDKEAAKKRFLHHYRELDPSIHKLFCLENDDKTYNLQDVVEISYGHSPPIPIIFDIHHHRCNPSSLQLSELLPKVLQSWKQVGRPKVHISSGKTSATDTAHHDYVFEEDFGELLAVMGDYEFDVMLESKKKDISCLRILKHLGRG